MATGIASPRVLTIADLRELAKRRLPRMVFDYIDGGADDEITLRENCRAFDDVMFRPRSAVRTPRVRSADDGARHRLDLPFLLAPVGSSRHVLSARRRRGRGGGRRGRHDLHPVDAVRLPAGRREGGDDAARVVSAVSRRRPRRRTRRIARARKAGYSALVVTIDTPVAGMRERDLRNGVERAR